MRKRLRNGLRGRIALLRSGASCVSSRLAVLSCTRPVSRAGAGLHAEGLWLRARHELAVGRGLGQVLTDDLNARVAVNRTT